MLTMLIWVLHLTVLPMAGAVLVKAAPYLSSLMINWVTSDALNCKDLHNLRTRASLTLVAGGDGD